MEGDRARFLRGSRSVFSLVSVRMRLSCMLPSPWHSALRLTSRSHLFHRLFAVTHPSPFPLFLFDTIFTCPTVLPRIPRNHRNSSFVSLAENCHGDPRCGHKADSTSNDSSACALFLVVFSRLPPVILPSTSSGLRYMLTSTSDFAGDLDDPSSLPPFLSSDLLPPSSSLRSTLNMTTSSTNQVVGCVTGASGLVGCAVAVRFLDLGHSVRLPVRKREQADAWTNRYGSKY